MIRKKNILTAFLAAWIIMGQAPAQAQTEFDLVEKPTEDQSKMILSLLEQIQAEARSIQSFYNDLKQRDKIDEKQKTFFPLRAELERLPGNPTKKIFNVSAVIEWHAESPARIIFHQRRGVVKQDVIEKRQIIFTVADGEIRADSIPIEIFVMESVNSDFFQKYNYKFPAADTPVRDEVKEIEYGGVKQKMNVIFLRDVETRIETLRETRDLFKLLTRRLDWYLREDARRKTQMLRNSFGN